MFSLIVFMINKPHQKKTGNFAIFLSIKLDDISILYKRVT